MGSPIAFQEVYKAGMEDFVIPVYEEAPFTTIQNRAKVTRSLKAIAGVERVHVKSINPISDEFGLNGEMVWEADNKDSRFRVVGNPVQFSNSSGSGFTTNTSDTSTYVEFTFYGTGLNWLGYPTVGALDYRASVDGGVEGSNFMTPQSTVLVGRNYSPNIILNVVSGLTLGWHTVKVRKNDTVSGMILYGFEVLNQRTDLAVYSGAGVAKGNMVGLSSLTTSSFSEGVSGTRGARVVKYIEGGQLKSAVQEVDATAKYLALADHSNEEVVRRINFREFGANRADDFSTLTGVNSNRAFTLDDGVTSLMVLNGNAQVVNGIDGVFPGAGSDYLVFTFIGTGLDVFTTSSGYSGNGVLDVDGVAQGSIVLPYGSSGVGLLRVCSGLPYGTHTVRINRTSGSAFFTIADFIIYQPKKPVIPTSVLLVADYCVVADYDRSLVTGTTSGDNDQVPFGVISASPARGFNYNNTWAMNLSGLAVIHGYNPQSTVAGYFEYRFFGTGADLHLFCSSTGVYTVSVTIDGVANATGAGLINMSNGGGGSYSTTSTSNGAPARLSITGLSLGSHTVRVTRTAGSTWGVCAINVITPIHINDSSLKVGSQSLQSLTKYSPEKSVSNAGPDLSKAKAWVYYDGINQVILASSNISAVLRSAAGNYYIYFNTPFKTDKFVSIGGNAANNVAIYRQEITKPSYIFVRTRDGAGQDADTVFSMAFFGELIDE